MKKILSFTCVCAAVLFAGCVSDNQTPKINGKTIDEVVKSMTLEQKAALVCGSNRSWNQAENAPQIGRNDQLVPGAAGVTTGFDSLGITQMCLSDGPAGLRINPKREGDTVNTYYCTGFPVGTVMASTWNQDLVQQEGAAMGNEVLEYGADVLLAPGMNIQRNPLCGRNFEYYSEDPVLSGKTAAAFVRGVQSNGVGVSVKHFIANNQETNRNQNDARMSVRALREIYLRNFEIAIKEGEPWTIMSSYNQLNGEYTAAEKELLTTIVRGEWGFKGFVMTDWGGGKQPVKSIAAGNDLLEPSGDAKAIIAAVHDGSLAESDLDACVRHILGIMVKSPRFRGYQYSNKPDLKAHAQVTRDAAAEGMILLKNDGSALPFGSSVKNIALFGMPSYDYTAGGTGSGNVNKAYTVSLTEGLSNAGYVINGDLTGFYEDSKAKQNAENQKKIEAMMKQNPQYRMFMNLGGSNLEDPELPMKEIDRAAQVSDCAIVTIGRQAGEGADRKNVKGDWELTDKEAAMINDVTAAFRKQGKKTVVVLNIGGPIETASWKDVPDAILLTWQAGQEGGNTVADILSGKVDPSGKLAVTFPVAYLDNPSSNDFPYD
ncbi:MAG: glycoside hydrolase family 3 protein, partial [Bacteroidales bacterium]